MTASMRNPNYWKYPIFTAAPMLPPLTCVRAPTYPIKVVRTADFFPCDNSLKIVNLI